MTEYWVPLSALQHFAFCPRQCALIHTEAVWLDNRFTVEGTDLHLKAHSGLDEMRAGREIYRSLQVVSHALGIKGVTDLVEIEHTDQGMVILPIEYKRGAANKYNLGNHLQLCGQALCLEEMLKTSIAQGAIFYGKSKRRHKVVFDEELRRLTIEAIGAVRALLLSGQIPSAIADDRCKNCSLKDHCLPSLKLGQARDYVAELMKDLQGNDE